MNLNGIKRFSIEFREQFATVASISSTQSPLASAQSSLASWSAGADQEA